MLTQIPKNNNSRNKSLPYLLTNTPAGILSLETAVHTLRQPAQMHSSPARVNNTESGIE